MSDERLIHKGFRHDRLRKEADNPREVAFNAEWQRINSGETAGSCTNLLKTLIGGCTRRDAMVAATVVQWLGSNVGMAFLDGAIRSCPETAKWLEGAVNAGVKSNQAQLAGGEA